MGAIGERRAWNKNKDEKEERRTTGKSKMAAEKRLFEQEEVATEVGMRMNALGVRRRTNIACSELAGAPTERVGHRAHDIDNQWEPPSSMETSSKRGGVS